MEGVSALVVILLASNFAWAQSAATIVLVVEPDAMLPKTVIPATIQAIDKSITVTIIDVLHSTTEKKLCETITAAKPSLMIDATLQPRDTTSKVSARVKKVARALGLPTISATYGQEESLTSWKMLTQEEKAYLIQIPPPGDTMANVVKSLVLNLKMNTMAVLYDDTFVMDHKIVSLLSNMNVRQNVRRLSKNPDLIKKTINEIVSSEFANFFVFGTDSTIKATLEAAASHKMFKKQYSWFIVSKDDIKTVQCNTCTMGLVLLSTAEVKDKVSLDKVKAMNFVGSQTVDVAFYYDLATMAVKTILTEGWPSPLTFPACPAGKLDDAMKAERKKANLVDSLRKNSVSGAYGKYVIRQNASYQDIELLLQQITLKSKGSTSFKKLGIWKAPSTLSLDGGQTLDEFKAISYYRVTTVIQPPFVMARINNKSETEYYGYCVDMLNEIKEMVGFEYSIFENEDKTFGILSSDNKWDGMMKDLITNKADIALGPISVMAEREIAVDFTVPFYDLVGISILLKKPDEQSSLFKFLTVLEPSVWGCILAAFFITSFLMYLFDRLSPYSFHNNREKYKDDEDQRDFNLKECLWFCMTSLTPQGGGEAPRNLSGRLVAATWWLFGFIIIASYTANLAAFLTVSRLDSTVDSLEALAKQYKIKYAPQKGSAAEAYFKRMSDIEERFYEIWKNMSLDDTLNATERAKLAVWDYPVSDKYTKIWWTISDSRVEFKSFDEGVAKVKASKGSSEGFALIADSTQVRYAVMTSCDLMQVGNEFSRKPLALAVQKGSELKDKLSTAIVKLLSLRKLDDLKEKWWTNNPENLKCKDRDQDGDGIGLDNIGGIFIVTAIGIAMAMASLLFEYWFFTMKQHNTKVLSMKDPMKR